MAIGDEVLTVKEVCELLQVNQSTVYKLIKEGRIPAFRIGTEAIPKGPDSALDA
jgi:excisionase family DNA binding protein